MALAAIPLTTARPSPSTLPKSLNKALAGMPGTIADAIVDAYTDAMDDLEAATLSAPIVGRADAVSKLKLLRGSFNIGPREDGADADALEAVISYLETN